MMRFIVSSPDDSPSDSVSDFEIGFVCRVVSAGLSVLAAVVTCFPYVFVFRGFAAFVPVA